MREIYITQKACLSQCGCYNLKCALIIYNTQTKKMVDTISRDFQILH